MREGGGARLGAALTAAALGCSACTTVHVHLAGDAGVQTTTHLGVARIMIDPGRRGTVIVRSAGLGAAGTVSGTTIGMWRETAVVLADGSACRTVIWAEDAAQVAEIERLLRQNNRSLETVCVIGPEEKR